ncbi:MBL fold metallo-hydrolase [Aerococcus agrisoli]|jgi:glyoxylase-like metal-dependent hydrolase (beta-lactamase superfamily II)|uniref:MBL fold metallo-hydrolase n=1 Tax=Aerococcus agrisoli TaxID=2487350 RepID=A0A3N4G3C8_9LACT|nr:MBL fold metallo-hydrolase [Aerococcus agrisoli]RPA57433.1 MBL fold metallo-hydrolase [Aerococcus agrisoli]
MLDQYKFHEMTFTWLNGTFLATDGGTLFGPVPRAVWGRFYPYNDNNQMPSVSDPILIQYRGKNYLIDASMDVDKLTDKSIRNLGVLEAATIGNDLAELGLTYDDIDVVMMTHMHNDHANGLTYYGENGLVSRFPNATIYMSEVEWDEVRHPNRRTRNTYLKENWEPIQDQVETFKEVLEVAPGITMEHTGGHSNGHAIVRFEQAGETALHMGDILISSVHTNPLWVGAVDDYPMDSIAAKERLMAEALPNGYKFLFYHDPFYRMIQYSEDAKEIVDGLKRSKPSLIPLTEQQDKYPKEQ